MRKAFGDFWNKLGSKERALFKGIVATVLVVGVAIVAGQMFKAKPDPLLDQYGNAMRDAGAQIKKDSAAK